MVDCHKVNAHTNAVKVFVCDTETKVAPLPQVVCYAIKGESEIPAANGEAMRRIEFPLFLKFMYTVESTPDT